MRAEIQRLLVTGDNRLKQGVDRREGRGRATSRRSSSRARRGSRTRSGRSLRSGWPTSNGSLENRLHPSRLTLESCASAAARAAGFGTGRAAAARRACRGAPPRLRVDEDAGSFRNELGRPADPGRDDRPPRPSPRAATGRAAPAGSAGRRRRAARGTPGSRRAARARRRARARVPRTARGAGRRRRRSAPPPRSARRRAPAGRRSCARSASRCTGRPGVRSGAGRTGKRSRSTPESTTSVLPRASGTFASSSRRR